MPELIVIAGCNGSGKSTYSNSLTPESVLPFDYDKHFLDIYNAKRDSELRERMSHNEAFDLLKQSVKKAIADKLDFCYETNFNSSPMHWPNIFLQEGYKLKMIFFCLDSIPEAKRRVQIRYENGGHYVPDHEVEERFRSGYKHLDEHFQVFDNIHLLDSSGYDLTPTHMMSITNGNIEVVNSFPEFMRSLVPNISRMIA